MAKIVILDGYAENPGDLSWEGLEALGELTVYDRTPADKIVERIADHDIVYTNKTPIHPRHSGRMSLDPLYRCAGDRLQCGRRGRGP